MSEVREPYYGTRCPFLSYSRENIGYFLGLIGERGDTTLIMI